MIDDLEVYNVVWTAPSQNAAGNMPIGNGEVGLNVWVEADGDLLFYIARTDAWSECNRPLKLGRIRVSLSPNPFVTGQPFRQELKLRDGQIEITAGDATIKVFVDADAPVIHVAGTSRTPRIISATLEIWRSTARRLTGEELDSCWTMREAPKNVEVWESADIVAHNPTGFVWYHRNETSIVPFTLRHQGLESLSHLAGDPLLHRTFGGRMSGKNLVAAGPNSLRTATPIREFELAIATHTAQTESATEWENQIPAPVSAGIAAARTANWWRTFWKRSWVFVGGDAGARVTQAYVLQRWITAGGGRGNYPIKFNGSIFTIDPKFTKDLDLSPDWRRWGECYWWQNTRLPYFAMIASGDFAEVRRLFWFYRDMLRLCETRAMLYHNVAGAYFPETVTMYGAYSNNDYGWDRTGHAVNEVLCPWWQYTWQQGLELVALMLDYYEHIQDATFLRDELIPMANAVLRYYDSRFGRDANGKLVISPTQSAETYWHDVINDTPSVAGLHDVVNRLCALPVGDREFWQQLKAATPTLPVTGERILPAEKFNPKRDNCENPELYAIWPFRLYGVGRPDIATGIATFQNRIEKASFGWQSDGQCAAILGLADEAKNLLLGKNSNSNPAHRFPAMWGPNYDWLPDQDHGSNILLTLQHMVLQASGDEIYVLPAWPQDWDISFKLHAPRRTVVECVYRNGRIEKLEVTPASRRKDLRVMLSITT